MAATVTAAPAPFGVAAPAGNTRRVAVTMTFDSSYPAGGYPLTPAACGLTQIAYVDGGLTQLGRLCQYIPSTGKVQVFVAPVGTAAAADMTAATDLHLDSVILEVVGF